MSIETDRAQKAEARIAALELSLAQERTAHVKTGLQWQEAKARIADLEAAAQDVVDQRQHAFSGDYARAPYVDLRRLRDLLTDEGRLDELAKLGQEIDPEY